MIRIRIVVQSKSESSSFVYDYLKGRTASQYIIDYASGIYKIGISLSGYLNITDTYILFYD
jgi:hypothetical protein